MKGSETKPVTKERCLAALDKISEVCRKRDKYGAVIAQASLNGLTSMIVGNVSETDNERLGLEMTIAGMPFPKSRDEIKQLLDQKQSLYEHYWGWRDRVYAIQAKHKLSGLELEHQTIFGVTIEQPDICSSDGLPFIEEDMPILRSYRPKIVAQFVQALRNNGVTECDKTLIVKRQGIASFDYVDSVVSVDEILVAAPLYDWACTWDNDGYPVINFGNGLDGTSLIGGHVSYEAILHEL